MPVQITYAFIKSKSPKVIDFLIINFHFNIKNEIEFFFLSSTLVPIR